MIIPFKDDEVVEVALPLEAAHRRHQEGRPTVAHRLVRPFVEIIVYRIIGRPCRLLLGVVVSVDRHHRFDNGVIHYHQHRHRKGV